MINIKVPKTAPLGGDLIVNIAVGRQGFHRTDIYKSGKWAPLKDVYVDPDAVSVEFSRQGKHNWRETVTLVVF